MFAEILKYPPKLFADEMCGKTFHMNGKRNTKDLILLLTSKKLYSTSIKTCIFRLYNSRKRRN